MANVPDLMSLLCLSSSQSHSPFGGQHRTILIEKDYFNAGDFVFSSILQHYGRREPNSRIVLFTLLHDWTNYSAAAAKCGANLRRTQNMGNIDVVDLMSLYCESLKAGTDLRFNSCKYLKDYLQRYFLQRTSEDCGDINKTQECRPEPQASKNPVIVMIDDLSSLLVTGSTCDDVVCLLSTIDSLMRKQSCQLQSGLCNLLVLQTMTPSCVEPGSNFTPRDSLLKQLVMNLRNSCDLIVALRPLETGHSTRVDGTLKIIDNRLPTLEPKTNTSAASTSALSFMGDAPMQIGTSKAYFFKLSDRRVRLTTSAMIF